MKIEINNNPFFAKNAIAFSVIALLFACFLWQIRANISLKQELNTKKDEFKEAKSASRRLKKLQQQIQGLEGREKTVNSMVPRNEQQPLGLVRTLSGLAADTGLKNAAFTIKEGKAAPSGAQAMETPLPAGIGSLRVEMSFESALSQALDFLKRAASIERVVAVEKVKIERKKEILPHQKVTLELVAYTFSGEN
ncbi:hypothetical protein EPN16_01910 [bacterium]|nr:MAG: hypothetical protein EPN16_01910 [bacterium]